MSSHGVPLPVRWGAAAPMAMAMMVLAVLLPYALGSLASDVSLTLGISASEFGLLPSAVYLTAAASSATLGALVDRIGLRQLMVGSLILCAAALAGITTATGLIAGLLWCALGGVILAISNPATNLLVTRAYPRDRWPRLMGWKQAGVPIAAMVAGLGIAPLAHITSWRAALLAISSLALLAAAAAWTAIPTAHRLATPAQPLAVGRQVRRDLRALTGFALVMGVGNGMTTSYYTLYATDELDVESGWAGTVLFVVGLAGAMTRILGVRVFSRVPLGVTLTLLAGLGVGSSLLVALCPLVGAWLMWPAAALSGIGALGWLAVAMLALAKHVPPERLGRASAIVSQSFYLGLVLGPATAALVLAATDAYLQVWVLQSLAYITAALLATSRSLRWEPQDE